MKKFLVLIQFLPLTIFLGIARSYGLSENGWELAFKYGAAAALLETIILLPIMGNQMSRLIFGANLFLVVGGSGFFFNNAIVLKLISELRETAIFISVGLISTLSIAITPTGVFEKNISKSRAEKKYSVFFIIGIIAVILWSAFYRGNPMVAGTIPFIFLIFLKKLLQHKLIKI